MNNKEIIEDLMYKDQDELFILLIQNLPEFSTILFSAENAKHEGKSYLKNIMPDIKQKICSEWGYCAKINNGSFKDNVDIIASVSDCILSIVGMIPATIIVTILFKKGLNSICECR